MGDGTGPSRPKDAAAPDLLPSGAPSRLTLKKRMYRVAARWDKQLLRKIEAFQPTTKPVRTRLPMESSEGDPAQLLVAVRKSDIATLIDYRRRPLWRQQLYKHGIEGLYLRGRTFVRHVIRVVLVGLNTIVSWLGSGRR